MTVLALVMIVLGGLWLRVDNLGRRSYSYDELFHVFAAKSLLESGTPALPSGLRYERGLPYTRAVALSFRTIGESEAAARAAVAAAGVVAIPVAFFLGRALFGAGTGLLAAFLLAFSPDAVAMSRFARLYAPAQLAVLLTTLLFYLMLEGRYRNGPAGWIVRGVVAVGAGAALLFGAALQAELYGLALPLGLYTAVRAVLDVRVQGLRAGLRSIHAMLLIVGALGVMVISVAVPDVPLGIWNRLMTRLPWLPESAWSPAYYHRYLSEHYGAIWLLAPAATIAAVVARWRPALYASVLFWVPFGLLSFVVPTQSSRYLFPFLPFLFVLVADGAREAVAVFWRSMERRIERFLGTRPATRWAAGALLLGTLVFAVRGSVWFSSAQGNRFKDYGTYSGATYDQWREAAAYVQRSGPADAAVLANGDGAALYYIGRLDGRLLYVNQAPSSDDQAPERTLRGWRYRSVLTGVPAFTDLSDLAAAIARHDHGWLILDRHRADLVQDGLLPEVRRFLRRCLQEHATAADASLVVLAWSRDRVPAPCMADGREAKGSADDDRLSAGSPFQSDTLDPMRLPPWGRVGGSPGEARPSPVAPRPGARQVLPPPIR